MEIILYILASWFVLDLMFSFLSRTGVPFLITWIFIKWVLKKILNEKACSINLHEEEVFTEKHTYEFKDERGVKIIYVNKCKKCDRRLISFYDPFSNMFNGWKNKNIKEGQHLKFKGI